MSTRFIVYSIFGYCNVHKLTHFKRNNNIHKCNDKFEFVSRPLSLQEKTSILLVSNLMAPFLFPYWMLGDYLRLRGYTIDDYCMSFSDHVLA